MSKRLKDIKSLGDQKIPPPIFTQIESGIENHDLLDLIHCHWMLHGNSFTLHANFFVVKFLQTCEAGNGARYKEH